MHWDNSQFRLTGFLCTEPRPVSHIIDIFADPFLSRIVNITKTTVKNYYDFEQNSRRRWSMKKTTKFKGTAQRDFNSILWRTYTDRPKPGYETLLIFKIFRNTQRFKNKYSFLCAVPEKHFRKNFIFRKIFLRSRNLFRNIFLTQ